VADVLEIPTPHGPARAHLRLTDGARAALVLGHGAGGGVSAPDLVAATRAAGAAGVSVVLVEQPYRVAGRRSPAPAAQLDAAWTAVVAELRGGALAALPLVTGGRSSGARVACRTAAPTGAAGVLCLAFPVHPPGRPEKTRLDELNAVPVPVLVIQGERDPFGMPPAAEGRTVVSIAGGHGLKADHASLEAAVTAWLAGGWLSSMRGSRRRAGAPRGDRSAE
jgi:predicted alpha/beta-hydrolase family hydrolase